MSQLSRRHASILLSALSSATLALPLAACSTIAPPANYYDAYVRGAESYSSFRCQATGHPSDESDGQLSAALTATFEVYNQHVGRGREAISRSFSETPEHSLERIQTGDIIYVRQDGRPWTASYINNTRDLDVSYALAQRYSQKANWKVTRDGDNLVYSTPARDLQRLMPGYDVEFAPTLDPIDVTFTLDSKFRLIGYSNAVAGGRVDATCGDFNAVEPIDVPDVEPEPRSVS